jgi:hypothetical protein
MICMTPHVVSSLAEPGRLCLSGPARCRSLPPSSTSSQAPVRQSDRRHADDGGAEAERARSWQELWGHYEGGGIMRRGLRGLGVAVGVGGMGGCVCVWERETRVLGART